MGTCMNNVCVCVCVCVDQTVCVWGGGVGSGLNSVCMCVYHRESDVHSP